MLNVFRQILIWLLIVAAVSLAVDYLRRPALPQNFSSTPLQTLDGRTVDLAALSHERPLLLYVWATWCGVCRYTTPDVARLQAQGKNVLTIALRSGDEPTLTHWLARKGFSFPVVNDASGALSRRWDISVTPTLIVVSKGEVVSTTSGWTSYWGMLLRLWWAKVS